MIRKAVEDDLSRVMEIVAQAVQEMQKEGNDQWDTNYPARADFAKDIQEATLFVWDDAGSIQGVLCLGERQPAEYQGVCWQTKEPCFVIRRMAVAMEARRNGIGRGMMAFAQEYALAKGVHDIRTNTYSRNPRMNRLFEACGYTFVGHISFKGRAFLFNCYEKQF